MKGTRRSKVWLALGLVAMACLVLAGCPHNNLLDNSGAGGGNGAGGRGGNADGVQLVITNFVADGGANRSASWLAGPNRTIAPEHIDLTKDDRIQEYIFVVTGTGDAGSYGPKIVDIASGTGVAALPGMNDGYWDITIDAYSVEKLKAKNIGGGAMQDRDAMMKMDEIDIPTNLVVHKADAVVLSGQASLHLGGNTNQVTLTLTPSSEAQFGDVNVAIHFTDATEKDKIFAQGTSKYVVKARLVDPASYQTIMGKRNGAFAGGLLDQTTEVTLFDLTGGPTIDRAMPGGTYEYKLYDKATGSYSDETVDENGGKLLLYKPSADPSNPAMTDAYKIPVGKYVLLVEVTDPDTKQTYYAMDSEFYVEGNRTTTGVLVINKLLGEKPKPPTGFEVYYSKPSTTDSKVGYDATFMWAPDPGDMAAVSYEIEIANITDLYKNDGNQSQVDVDGTPDNAGHRQFTNGQELWSDTTGLYAAAMDTIRPNYVTTVTWSTQTKVVGYPFVAGSLLAGGDNKITLRLETGSVYSARIRATNGTSNNSNWVYFTDIAPAPGGAGAAGTEFAQAKATGIFDLVALTYKLQAVDMYTLTGDRSADMTIQGDTLETDLLQVYEYNPGNPGQALSYGFTKDQLAKTVGEQVLAVKGGVDKKIVPSWQGWQAENDRSQMFGPVANPPQAAKDAWKYSGFKSLVLVPVGAGGSELKVNVETADTTNVLSLDTVGFDDTVPNAAPLPASTVKTAGLQAYTQSAPPGVYRNTAGTKLIVVLDADLTNRNNANTELYVAIGDSDKAGGVDDTLTDKNGNPITVTNLEVALKKGTSTYRTTAAFTQRTDNNPAYAVFTGATKLGGLNRGQYTLYVKMTTASGYEQTTQIPIWIVYQDQTATIAPTTFD